jgi:hypothetical protein
MATEVECKGIDFANRCRKSERDFAQTSAIAEAKLTNDTNGFWDFERTEIIGTTKPTGWETNYARVSIENDRPKIPDSL